MIAVAGATGHTGKAVADALLQLDRPVRVIVRDAAKGESWKARGAEVAVASLGDADALARALRGPIPPTCWSRPLTARRTRWPRNASSSTLWLRPWGGANSAMSCCSPQSEASTRRRRTDPDAPCRRTGVGRDGALDNGAARAVLRRELGGCARRGGRTRHPAIIPPLDQPIEMAATADIGGVAAELLLGPAPAGFKAVEMGGHAPLSPRELAVSLGQILGRHIEPILVPLDQVVPTFTGLGFSESAATLIREMYRALLRDGSATRTRPPPRSRDPDACRRPGAEPGQGVGKPPDDAGPRGAQWPGRALPARPGQHYDGRSREVKEYPHDHGSGYDPRRARQHGLGRPASERHQRPHRRGGRRHGGLRPGPCAERDRLELDDRVVRHAGARHHPAGEVRGVDGASPASPTTPP